MKRAFVFIDGSNLYYRLKSISDFYTKETGQRFSLSRFNFKEFCRSVVGENNLLEVRYYVGQIKRPNSKAKNVKKVEEVKELGKKVVYVGVKRIPKDGVEKKDAFGLSFGLVKTANDIKIIEKDQVKKFLAVKKD